MTISDRIQKLRKERNLSQEQLADELGISRQAVSKWESDSAMPDIDKIIALSDYFETSTDYILEGVQPSVQKQSSTFLNPEIAGVGRAALNIIGSLLAICMWFEYQRSVDVIAGLAFIVLGNMFFAMSLTTIDIQAKGEKLYGYIKKNIWIIAFVPVSSAVSAVTGFRMRPVPLLTLPPVTMVFFILIYMPVCLLLPKMVKKKYNIK